MLCCDDLFLYFKKKVKNKKSGQHSHSWLVYRNMNKPTTGISMADNYADAKNHAGKKALLTVLSSQLFII